MNKKNLVRFACAAVLASAATPRLSAAELLVNGNFETDVQTGTGDHQGVTVTGWTITPTGDANLARGPVTGGSTALGSGASNLPLDPNDTTPNAMQSLDLSASGTASQTFFAIATAPATIKFDIGDRDAPPLIGGNPGSTWTLVNVTTNQTVATSANLDPAFNAWATNTSTTPALVNGNQYRFTVNLDNANQVDGLSVQQVPEPTTLTAAGIGAGLLGWVSFKRRRRA